MLKQNNPKLQVAGFYTILSFIFVLCAFYSGKF